jgi:hypothetical protein
MAASKAETVSLLVPNDAARQKRPHGTWGVAKTVAVGFAVRGWTHAQLSPPHDIYFLERSNLCDAKKPPPT